MNYIKQNIQDRIEIESDIDTVWICQKREQIIVERESLSEIAHLLISLITPVNHSNTLIEIPKETIGYWNREAQSYSMEKYGRVESAIVELYMKLATEKWRADERHKNTYNEMFLNLSKQIEQLKMQIK